MSAGGGLFFDGSFNNGYDWTDKDKSSGENIHRILSFGGYVFFDATYVEASIGFSYGAQKGEWSYKGPWGKGSGDWENNLLQLNFSVLANIRLI